MINADPIIILASKKPKELLGLNSSRKQGLFYNDSPFAMYLFFRKPNKENWSVKIRPDGYFELPQPVFPDRIYGRWDGEKGSCRITELS